MRSTTTFLLGCMMAGTSCIADAADVREIELRRLFEPTQGELTDEASGRIYIYDGLRDTDIERAMEEQFERIDNMMFIREKPTDEKGEVLKDPETGEELVADDGC